MPRLKEKRTALKKEIPSDETYRQYVIEKVKKGQEAVKQGQAITTETLKRKIRTW